MEARRDLLALVATTLLAATACGPGSSTAAQPQAPTTSTTAPAAQPVPASSQAASPVASAPASTTSLADDLQKVRMEIYHALTRLSQGNVKAAKEEYQEFEEGWEKVEDGVRAKSRDLYRKIEEAMDEVKIALLKPEQPDSAKAEAALKGLDATVESALPALR